MQRVLVTGAGGYIGRHLLQELSVGPWEVRGLVHRGDPPSNGKTEWVRADILDRTAIAGAMQGCDLVVHLACKPMAESNQDPRGASQVNTIGTLNVMLAARAANIQRVIYTSTAQVYGRDGSLPLKETAPTRPDSAYATSKLGGETVCEGLAREYGMSAIILRLFNVYGSFIDGISRETVETAFMRRLLTGKKIQITSHPNEGRDFVHIRDVARAIRSAMEHDGAGIETMNIGCGELTTLTQLAGLVGEIAKSKSAPVIAANAERAPLQLQADIRKAKQVLGFQPAISLREGLAELYELEKAHLGVTQR